MFLTKIIGGDKRAKIVMHDSAALKESHRAGNLNNIVKHLGCSNHNLVHGGLARFTEMVAKVDLYKVRYQHQRQRRSDFTAQAKYR